MKSDFAQIDYVSPECRNEELSYTGILCSSTVESANASISDMETGGFLDFGF